MVVGGVWLEGRGLRGVASLCVLVLFLVPELCARTRELFTPVRAIFEILRSIVPPNAYYRYSTVTTMTLISCTHLEPPSWCSVCTVRNIN